MPAWSSFTHSIEIDTGGFRTFTVLEHTADALVHGAAAPPWRTVTDGATGEVVRRFDTPPGQWQLAPYDFSAGEAWLKEKYGKKLHGFAPVPHIPSIGEVYDGWTATSIRDDVYGGNVPPVINWMKRSEMSMQTHYRETQGGTVTKTWTESDGMATNYTSGNYSSGNITISAGGANTFVSTFHAPTVPDGASYFDECKYGGECHDCGMDIEAGDAIWAWKPERGRWRIWCPRHKQRAPAAKSARVEHDEEHDMAQMMEFRFPYTGTQIAAALEAKAAKLDAEAAAVVKLDVATLEVVYPSRSSREEFLKKQDDSRARLEATAAKIRKEAVPFTQAGNTKFELDLEDIGHYALDETDVPRKATRKPRKTRDVVMADA